MNNNVGYITYCRSILFILLHLLCVHLFAASKNDEGQGDATSVDIGPTLIDSLISRNWGRIGEKFFNLPSTSSMIKELKSMKSEKKN